MTNFSGPLMQNCNVMHNRKFWTPKWKIKHNWVFFFFFQIYKIRHKHTSWIIRAGQLQMLGIWWNTPSTITQGQTAATSISITNGLSQPKTWFWSRFPRRAWKKKRPSTANLPSSSTSSSCLYMKFMPLLTETGSSGLI